MVLLLTCRIEIGDFYLKSVNEVEITDTWRELGAKCTIKLPVKGVLRRKDGSSEKVSLEQVFATGMPVKVFLGYSNNNNLEFIGYISKIKPNEVLEIECEDELYRFKRSDTITSVFSGSLKGLLEVYFPEARLSKNIPDVALVNFILKRVTKAEVLQKLKDEYNLFAYFQGGLLYVGLPYLDFTSDVVVKYHFQKNIVSSRDLVYRKSEDTRIRLKVVSYLPNRTKVEVEVGDKDAEQRTVIVYGESDKTRLESIGLSKIEGFRYNGFEGGFEVFGIPFVQHSQVVFLDDGVYTERVGSYFVDKVAVKFGSSGFRRVVSIGIKV